MLWAPSWGGMLNGLLTLRGAWDKLRTDPVLKFFVAGVTFYGMATFEGPLLSIKSVSGLGHYTDWIIGHVHAGALGWNGFMLHGRRHVLLAGAAPVRHQAALALPELRRALANVGSTSGSAPSASCSTSPPCGHPRHLAGPDESIYDHPFQWGSKRTGPDLARVGTKYPNLWHYQHMTDPRSMSPGSLMPPYDWMADRKIDMGDTVVKLRAMKTLGVPYTDEDISEGSRRAEADGRAIAADLATQGVEVAWDSEMVAIIAYLQSLGKNTGAHVTTSAAVSNITTAK
jgi:hypothetical protein